jgi:CubicO group peptidase (beta-lactamase class C family)
VVLAPPSAQEALERKVDNYIQDQMASLHIPGLSMAVVQDGKVVYAKAYGYANLQGPVAARLDDRFQIGSMSKAFVATATMMLVEEGKIGLDQPVSRYLGAVPASWAGMTVRHLLNHTSGLPEYPDPATVAALNGNTIYSEDQLLGFAMKMAMVGAPGGGWSYSNIAYDVLGILIGKVSGKPYGDLLQQRIFGPLGMSNTRMLAPQQSMAGSAVGYVRSKGVVQAYQTTIGHMAYLSLGASGVEASVLDMAKWDAALRTEQLLKKSSLDQMWTVNALVLRQSGTLRADVNYGLGWFLTDINDVRMVYHSGSMPAFTSDFIRYLDAGLSVVILTNIDYNTADPQPMTRAVARMFNPAMP